MAGAATAVEDNMEKRAEDLMKRIEDSEAKIVREEGRKPIISPAPDRPTEDELKEHNTTHTSPKPWCPYCNRGAGKRDDHARMRKDIPDVEATIDKVPMLSIDYLYLYEKGERPTLVMVDHECGKVWAYALKDNHD